MALEDEQINPQVSEAEAPPIRQFLKVQKQGMGRAAVAQRIKENDILVAIDGELFLGDKETLKAVFEDYDPTMVDDVAWLVTFWRDGVFFNVCFHTPLRADFDFVSPEEAIEVSEGFKKLKFWPIESYQNFEVFRDLRKNAAMHPTAPDPLATYAPLLWMLGNRLYYPMLAITIVYGITAVTHILLFILGYILVGLYVKRAQLNLLRSYHLFEDKFYWMVIGATNEIEARQTCRALDPGVLFPFDKAEPPKKLNRIQRKAMREQQPTTKT
jgi:hypothetical protein